MKVLFPAVCMMNRAANYEGMIDSHADFLWTCQITNVVLADLLSLSQFR